MRTQFLTPPILQGDAQRQLASLRDYLVGLSKTLTTALSTLDETNFTDGSEARSIVSGSSSAASKEISTQTESLKSLIVNTATIIRSEMDAITTTLEGKYLAESDFGTYAANYLNEINLTPDGLDQRFKVISDLAAALGEQTAGFDKYLSFTSGFVKVGIVDYQTDGVTPIFGVAVGQGIRTIPVEIAGDTYDEFDWASMDASEFLTLYTAGRISFRKYGAEVAYISNDGSNVLWIATVHVDGALEMGDEWRWTRGTKGMTLKWVGATT